ncbi:glycosyltransferase family 2 protein [Lacticaseibacillus sp. 866-1]|uniref:glycosyltransferase family 2 protein n=1 Tax=Lacticaseibacillus sp. 866-1 TaxID=2799576 RepID=UPI00194564AB|nr:glycosyltransferase family 2 protein [Lacticaseibacillus sp. 866-1]
MDKIGCVIVTYNPDVAVFERNITAVMPQITDCVVVDNGSVNSDQIRAISDHFGASFLPLKENIGIAAAQNRGFQMLQDRDDVWGLTLDQDSVIPDDMIASFCSTTQILDQSAGLLAPVYLDTAWTAKQAETISPRASLEPRRNKMLISSGSLIRVEAWHAVQGFDESLFIDMVDYDFDEKLLLAGYELWQFPSIVMRHSVGDVVHRPWLRRALLIGSGDLLADHSAFRQFYIYRNSMIFAKRYGNPGRFTLFLKTLIATRRIFAYPEKKKKFRAAFKGIRAGFAYDVTRDVKFQSTMAHIEDYAGQTSKSCDS